MSKAKGKEKDTVRRGDPKPRAVMSRRTLCAGIGGAVVMLGVGGLKYVPSSPGVRPPGGQDEDRLEALCVRCQRCCEACPHHVIVPAHIERGILVARTPEMDFSDSYCTFCAEENGGVPLCAQACPTGALWLPEGADAQATIMGKASITEDWCLAYNAVTCQFCFDVCPYDAIEMVGGEKMKRPRVIAERCNGCGACESVCGSLQNGSISTGATSRAIVVVPEEEL